MAKRTEDYRNFLDTLVEQGEISLAESRHFQNLTTNHKETCRVISQLQERITRKIVTPKNSQDLRVQKGWTLIGDYVKARTTVLNYEDIIFFVGGSMEFDDPRNLDLDAIFFTVEENPRFREMHKFLAHDLNRIWIANFGEEGIPDYLSLEQIEGYSERITQGEINFFPENSLTGVHNSLGQASYILTAYPFFHSSDRLLLQTRNKVRELYVRYPILAACIRHDLESTLEVRRK